jgi:hypothetical protein
LQDSTYSMTPPPPLPPSGPLAEAERIRHELLEHEAELKFYGLFYLLGGIVGGLAFLAMALAVALGQLGRTESGLAPWLFLMVFGGLGSFLYLWLGIGLRRCDRKVRKLAIVMAAFGLLAFPVGTLINGYFLYLLLGEKGSRVLSPEYQAVIAATPHIKRKSPWLVGCLVASVLLFAGIFALAIYFSRTSV